MPNGASVVGAPSASTGSTLEKALAVVGSGSATAASVLFLMLKEFPETVDCEIAIENLYREPEYLNAILEMLGKSSTHRNQLTVARNIAMRLLVEDVDGLQKLAFNALANDTGSQISNFSRLDVLRNLGLPLQAAN